MFEDKKYSNRFLELGYTEDEVKNRLDHIVHTIFFGAEGERFYELFEDMAYVTDTGNNDVRTEGMSYAMMVFVQLDMKEAFNRIWKFAKTFMYISEGENKGYFAWSVGCDGTKLSNGPAPDGEEYFAMALFFASNRWGDGVGIYNYGKEARDLLSICVHKGEGNDIGSPMWEPSNHLIKFIPNLDFSDPSYHLPHFYRLFSLWANIEDKHFWMEAASASLNYIKKSCHPITGLSSEYADYDGHPKNWHGHDCFYSDSYRVASNIGLYHEWFGDDLELCHCVMRLQRFFIEKTDDERDYVYAIDGCRKNEKVLHPTGLVSCNAMGSLATTGMDSDTYVDNFYHMPLRTGSRRYYDNFLYLFAFLALSGNYRIWG
jgi:oligosaccharide reducing-end xylanase